DPQHALISVPRAPRVPRGAQAKRAALSALFVFAFPNGARAYACGASAGRRALRWCLKSGNWQALDAWITYNPQYDMCGYRLGGLTRTLAFIAYVSRSSSCGKHSIAPY